MVTQTRRVVFGTGTICLIVLFYKMGDKLTIRTGMKGNGRDIADIFVPPGSSYDLNNNVIYHCLSGNVFTTTGPHKATRTFSADTKDHRGEEDEARAKSFLEVFEKQIWIGRKTPLMNKTSDRFQSSGSGSSLESAQVQFTDIGCTITLFGIKNDTSRTGFEVSLPHGSISKLDPVINLKDYVERTECYREVNGPVFLTLKSPFSALSASSIARVLDDSIKLAGLEGRGFTAKSLRLTDATAAIESQINPDIVRKLGRWKNSEVFYEHYVHARTQGEYTNVLLKHD